MKRRAYNYEDHLKYDDFGACCFYCKDKVDFLNISDDHIYPRVKGFIKKDNIIYSCGDCNSIKGHLTPYQFRELMSHAFVFYCHRGNFKKAEKALRIVKTITELINDKNSVLYQKKFRHNRANPGRCNPYYPKEKDIIGSYRYGMGKKLLLRYPHK